MNYSFSSPSEKDLEIIQNILCHFSLPFEDIQKHLSNFILTFHQNKLVGIVGLEIYGSIGLLRSLVVLETQRNFGLGKLLVQKAIDLALSKEVKELFLLTTTAENYFLRLGFENFDRKKVPLKISETMEFSSLCPSSAICLHKII
ncbi:MAG: GNAT family N-acetyltransferase [Calditrichaeota bacterium]|nr:MAG: GNAT family N-acetyltransferase [Calditrichota bacterium]